MTGSLESCKKFQCGKCLHKVASVEATDSEPNIGDVESVDTVCYLNDMLSAGGGVVEAVRCRIRCALGKFNEFASIITSRGTSLKLKGKFYKACVRSVMIYGSETWALRVEGTER